MGTGWHPKPTPSRPREAAHRRYSQAQGQVLLGLWGGAGSGGSVASHPQGLLGWPLTQAFPGPGTPLPSLFFSFFFFFLMSGGQSQNRWLSPTRRSLLACGRPSPGGRKLHVLLTKSPSPQGLEPRLQSRSPAGGGKGMDLLLLERGHQVTQPTRCQSWGCTGFHGAAATQNSTH